MNIAVIKKRYPDEYRAIYNPILNRRQRIALSAFLSLNRDRDYISIGDRLKPLNIKLSVIKDKWENLTNPIAFEIFKRLIQSLDDVFIEFSLEQIKNGS